MKITYYSFKLLVLVFRRMPFWQLYLCSDFIAFVIQYVFPYRKKIVKENINNSFPNMSGADKARMIRAFNRNLCDILLESIKGFGMGPEALVKRYKFINPEILGPWFDQGRQIISTGAHYANWEWGIMAASLQLRHKNIAFYTSLTNKYIDEMMGQSRGRFGSVLLPSQKVRAAFTGSYDRPVSFFFGADQVPSNLKGVHWMEFLNQDTACMKGPEFFARRYDLPVFYFDVQRVKRGHYTVEIHLLEDKPKQTEDGEITEKYMRFLEEIIKRKPEDYLWTHRRWKRKRDGFVPMNRDKTIKSGH